jgi:hypothetical protein
MSRGDIETYYEDGQWKNKVEGNDRALSVHETRAAAVGAGQQVAMLRKVEHIIRNMDGTIDDRNSYGNDPRNVPG